VTGHQSARTSRIACEAGAGPVPKLPARRHRTAGAGCSSPRPWATPGLERDRVPPL